MKRKIVKKQAVTMKDITDQMGLANDVKFNPTVKQQVRFNKLVKDPSVQKLSKRDIDTLVDGEYLAQLKVAGRSPALSQLHVLLEEIFNDI